MTHLYEIIGAERDSRWVVSCDHASNHVPLEIGGGSLGLPAEQMGRHIAYDLGAVGVSRALADSLGAAAVLSRFSRLVIDPNRGEDDPTLIMRLYDGTVIPGNKTIDAAERARRIATYHAPYHAALGDLLARRTDPVLVAVHSFTPKLVGRSPRPWQIGILYADDTRLSAPFIRHLRTDPEFAEWVKRESGAALCVGENQPYAGHLPGDAVDRQALQHGRMNVLIELRHDLIQTAQQQIAWARWLAILLERALPEPAVADQNMPNEICETQGD